MSNNLIYGMHAVEAVLEKDPIRILEVWVQAERKDDRLGKLISSFKDLGIAYKSVNRSILDTKTKKANHQGIVVLVKSTKPLGESDLKDILEKEDKQHLFLILDGVTDPHNLGACLRSADAAGVSAVIVPKDKAASLNAIVSKVACGAAEAVPFIRVTNLARTMRYLKEQNVWCIGTAGEADHSLFKSDLAKGNIAIVMGAEGDGMRRLTKDTCDELVSLPMAGVVSSLNVSVATGVCLFEVVRQRNS